MEKIKIKTYGCALNQADSAYIRGLLEEHEFEKKITIVNTCTVKTPTERKIKKELDLLEEKQIDVIVAGCLPAAQPEIVEEYPSFSFIGTNTKDIVEAIKAVEENKRYVNVGIGEKKTGLPKKRYNRLIETIPIASGCLGNCSYCITKKARGKLNSYPIREIKKNVREAIEEGAKEIRLTAQDTGAYGKDLDSDLCELLEEILQVEGDYRIRLGMLNPDHARQMLSSLLEIYEDKKMYKFLHVPVQSGDNQVLKDMNRRYKVKDFVHVVNEFREKFPYSTISTDVIAGFCTENEEAFQNTVDLIKQTKPDVLNISRFWLRPHTKAQEMPHMPTRITKDRSRVINRIFEKIGLERNKPWIGWQGKVRVLEKGKGNSVKARNDAYRPVIIQGVDENLLGEKVEVEIIDATHYDLRARLLE